MSYVALAERLGVTALTARRWVGRYEAEGEPINKPKRATPARTNNMPRQLPLARVVEQAMADDMAFSAWMIQGMKNQFFAELEKRVREWQKKQK
jgi:transposase